MPAVRAAGWRSVAAAGALAAAGVAPPRPPRPTPPAAPHPCAAAWCTPTRPTPADSAAIAAEADRLVARYAADATPLGRQCHALGLAIRERAAADVRMVAFMWRAADPDGNLAAVAADAHGVEPAAGAGRVHVARGVNALNPDRGLPAVLQSVRHEFAHLAGARQGDEWAADAGAHLATACGA
jgi:hypothetical protein